MIDMLIKGRNYLRSSWEFYMVTPSLAKPLTSLGKSAADRLASIGWRSNIHFSSTPSPPRDHMVCLKESMEQENLALDYIT